MEVMAPESHWTGLVRCKLRSDLYDVGEDQSER